MPRLLYAKEGRIIRTFLRLDKFEQEAGFYTRFFVFARKKGYFSLKSTFKIISRQEGGVEACFYSFSLAIYADNAYTANS